MSDAPRAMHDGVLEGAELRTRLAATWADPPGVIGWLSAIDHKTIALRFVVTAFVFLALAGGLAVVMRLQLARPENGLIDPSLYAQLFSMHGTTMMFLFAVPVMEAMALYLVPLMVGARSIAFPRLGAFAYWVYLAGGAMLWIAFALNTGAENGWFSYVPLAGPQYSPGKRADFWAQMVTFTEVSAIAVAIQLIVTVLKQRAPGMTLDRIPLFCWAIVVTDFAIMFAMPAVMLASGMLMLDRLVGTHFFNPAEGGDALLWQHLFWFFGHPEVYIIFLPATGMVSAIVVAFARRPMFGYPAMVLSLIAIGFLSFGLWVHHMFVAGIPQLGGSLFTASSMLIAIPNGLQIFCWIATLWSGRPIFAVPLLWVIGFVITFVIGGLTGVMLASIPIDMQVHDTYFVVAHFHYVLIGGAVFPLLGAIVFWFPKVCGRLMDERLGRWSFWLVLIGFHLTFFPMHILGLRGMPRRVYTYLPEMGWADLNLFATAAAFMLVAGFVLFIGNAVWSWRAGQLSGANPWGAGTLEWATSSPPPPHNFDRVPIVGHREPLWAARDGLPTATGLAVDRRESLVASLATAEPEARESFPRPSIWPFLAALATTALFIGTIFTPWAVVWFAAPLAITLIGWFWPKPVPEDEA